MQNELLVICNLTNEECSYYLQCRLNYLNYWTTWVGWRFERGCGYRSKKQAHTCWGSPFSYSIAQRFPVWKRCTPSSFHISIIRFSSKLGELIWRIGSWTLCNQWTATSVVRTSWNAYWRISRRLDCPSSHFLNTIISPEKSVWATSAYKPGKCRKSRGDVFVVACVSPLCIHATCLRLGGL
jgi:hypothetical protein